MSAYMEPLREGTRGSGLSLGIRTIMDDIDDWCGTGRTPRFPPKPHWLRDALIAAAITDFANELQNAELRQQIGGVTEKLMQGPLQSRSSATDKLGSTTDSAPVNAESHPAPLRQGIRESGLSIGIRTIMDDIDDWCGTGRTPKFPPRPHSLRDALVSTVISELSIQLGGAAARQQIVDITSVAINPQPLPPGKALG